MIGAAGGAFGIGVSELFAGLVHDVPSLVVAVGDLVIRFQPPGATDLVIVLFGTNDKLALKIAVVVVALTVAALGGLLGRLHFWATVLIFVLLGVAAGGAAAREVLADPAAAAANAGLAVASGLGLVWALSRSLSSDTGTARPDPSRRRLLIATAGTLCGVVVGGLGHALVVVQRPTSRAATAGLPPPTEAAPGLAPDERFSVPGISPLVVPNDDFYRIDTALVVPSVDVGSWSLQVSGMVDRALSISYDELVGMPLHEQYVTLACVSNEVGGHLVGNALWTGVPLKHILGLAGVNSGATQIVGRSVDDFWVGFPTAWAMAPEREPMIAVGMNREPLPAEHGFPARLIVPGLFGYTSATKWLSQIELATREAVDGYWIPLGYAKDGPILTQSRIDVPKNGEVMAAGNVDIAGVAWAPDRGIGSVEVRVDDNSWRAARLSRARSPATWVQWMLAWQLGPGRHTIEVRATDGTGDIQTDRHTDPGAPDGARGHHRIGVVVG
jgi:DMSO/TMAO reductase YedYZ molybdopterin-dependent catalytic subunit